MPITDTSSGTLRRADCQQVVGRENRGEVRAVRHQLHAGGVTGVDRVTDLQHRRGIRFNPGLTHGGAKPVGPGILQTAATIS